MTKRVFCFLEYNKRLRRSGNLISLGTMNNSFSIGKIFGGKEKTEPFKRVRIAADGTMEQEGQLAVDVYQTEDDIIIIAPLAGVRKEDVELKIVDDVITIEGSRKKPAKLPDNKNFLVQECFWGSFSRSIILPAPVKNDKVKAGFEDGILKITIPKSDRLKTRIINITD